MALKCEISRLLLPPGKLNLQSLCWLRPMHNFSENNGYAYASVMVKYNLEQRLLHILNLQAEYMEEISKKLQKLSA
jgi:hypothetical protein